MPDFELMSAIHQIRARYPDLKILVVSAYDDDKYVQGLLSAGVHGYHLKNQPLSDLRLAVQRVLAGERWVCSPLVEKLMRRSLNSSSDGSFSENMAKPPMLTFFGKTFKVGETAITYGSVLMVVLFVAVWFLLRYTPSGRYIYAVGDNPEAARLAGIPTTRLLIGVYMLAAFFYSIAALLFIARTGAGDPRAGENLNLEAITAVVLGGTSLFSGRGNILGTFIGALTVGVFRNGQQLMGVPSIYQVLITGVLVILAVSIDQLSRRGK